MLKIKARLKSVQDFTESETQWYFKRIIFTLYDDKKKGCLNTVIASCQHNASPTIPSVYGGQELRGKCFQKEGGLKRREYIK